MKLISLVEAKKVAFGTILSTEPFVILIFRRGIIARHAPRRRKRGVVNDFCARETQIYQLSRLSDLETWHLCGGPLKFVIMILHCSILLIFVQHSDRYTCNNRLLDMPVALLHFACFLVGTQYYCNDSKTIIKACDNIINS